MAPCRLWPGTASLVFAVLILVPGMAHAERVHAFDRLSEVLKTGDLIEIADTSGREIRGRLSELTDCSIVVTLSGTNRATVLWNGVKKIRRLRAARSSDIATAARTCDSRDCPPTLVVVSGMAAVAHGFGAVFNRPQTVYRAPKQPATTALRGSSEDPRRCR